MEASSYWVLFLSAAILLNIAPGPDMIYLISKTMSQGKRVGFASILGLGTGALIHTYLSPWVSQQSYQHL